MKSLLEKRVRGLLITFFVIVAGGLLAWKLTGKQPGDGREVSVMIEGHVKRPGMYYVPYGTTAFEVLRVAGVMPNSDLNNVDVNATVTDGDKVNVGTLEKNVTMKGGSQPYVGAPCVVNFVTGKVSVTTLQGTQKAPVRNVPLAEGDRILCAADGMIEIRLGDGTLVDLKKNSELQIQSLYTADSSGMLAVTLHLATGKLWSFIKSQPPNVSFRFTTPHLIAEIRGTEIEISADKDQSKIGVIKGMVFVGKYNESDRVTLTEGQKATIDAVADKPVETGSLTDGEKGGDEDLKAFSQQRDKYLAQNAVRRFMFLVLPDFYCVFEMDPFQRKILVYRIPANTPVGDYVEGVNELSKVYLYGGVGLTTSLIERITERPIEHFMILDRPDIISIVDNLGGVFIDVDDRSAAAMGIKAGYQKLDGNMMLKYFSPRRDDREKGIDRQNRAMYAIFDASNKRRLVFNAVLFTKLFMNLETDVTVDYSMESYNTFTAASDWKCDFVFLGSRNEPAPAAGAKGTGTPQLAPKPAPKAPSPQ
ncbi:MAG: LCP family protein [Fibrobacterota bacterium]